jgi:protein TonB
VAPEYPELARRAGVEGVVVIDCTIEPLGLVSGVQVLSGHPLLNQAALEAVRQWRYEPTRINGVPVPVVLTVTLRFNLRRP